MNIIVNGESQQVAEDCTALELVQSLNMQNEKIAMEINLEIVPRSEYAQHKLNEGDKIEIVRAIGGG